MLQWYCQLEDNCCLLLASKCLLQKTWRHESIRVRHELARIELPHLSNAERKARLLDDLWQETLAIVPHFADVLATIPELKVLKGPKLLEVELQIKMDMIYIQNSLKELTESSRVSEILEITEIGIAYSNETFTMLSTASFFVRALLSSPRLGSSDSLFSPFIIIYNLYSTHPFERQDYVLNRWRKKVTQSSCTHLRYVVHLQLSRTHLEKI